MGKNQSASNLANIIQYNNGNITFVSGSTTLMSISASGAITTTGVISGSNALSASYAATGTSASYAVSATSASYAVSATSASYAVSATTASYADALTVAGTLTAQTLVVQTITSSVDYVTGSTQFGSILANTHVFSGSVTINPGGLFVSGSGAVGIGTTTPTVRLQVNGTSTYEPMVPGAATGSFAVNSGNGLYGLYVGSRGTGDTWMQGGRNDGTATAYNLILQANGGNVTIGGTGGSERLNLANRGAIGFQNASNVQKWHIQYNDADGLNFVESDVADFRLFLKAGGNVGIGTSSPSYLLDVNGNARVTNLYAVNDRNNFSRGSIRLTAAGNNASTLDINVNDSITNIYSNYYGGGNDNTIIIGTYANNSNQLVLKSNGRIGIGTTNPQFTLDVNGGVRTTGLSVIDAYSGQYTTDSSWTSFQTVIPANTLNAYETYLVEIRWEYNNATYAPYYADAAFLFKPVPTNSTGVGNTIALQTSCHVGGDYIIYVAHKNEYNTSAGGLAVKFSWSTSSPSYVLVKAKRIAIP